MASRNQKLSNMRATTCRPTEDGGLEMTYHKTVVFRSKRQENGAVRIRLDTGGYHTDTTKRRINWCFDQMEIPVQIYQKDWTWHLHLGTFLLAPEPNKEITFERTDITLLLSKDKGKWQMIDTRH